MEVNRKYSFLHLAFILKYFQGRLCLNYSLLFFSLVFEVQSLLVILDIIRDPFRKYDV